MEQSSPSSSIISSGGSSCPITSWLKIRWKYKWRRTRNGRGEVRKTTEEGEKIEKEGKSSKRRRKYEEKKQEKYK
jgi:hypothetical protein